MPFTKLTLQKKQKVLSFGEDLGEANVHFRHYESSRHNSQSVDPKWSVKEFVIRTPLGVSSKYHQNNVIFATTAR